MIDENEIEQKIRRRSAGAWDYVTAGREIDDLYDKEAEAYERWENAKRGVHKLIALRNVSCIARDIDVAILTINKVAELEKDEKIGRVYKRLSLSRLKNVLIEYYLEV